MDVESQGDSTVGRRRDDRSPVRGGGREALQTGLSQPVWATAGGRGGAMMHVLAIAETDSYAGWSAGTAHELSPAPVHVVLDTALRPSHRQLERTGVDGWLTVSPPRLGELVASRPPHVVVLGVRGPILASIVAKVRHAAPGAVIVNGLPGPALPLDRRARRVRSRVDVVVAHSRYEREALRRCFGQSGPTVALGTLPAIRRSSVHRSETTHGRNSPTGDGVLLFAEQSAVPRGARMRRELARRLVELPIETLVIKRRALPDEAATHADRLPMVQLIEAERRRRRGPDIVVDDRPVLEALVGVTGCITVGSTVGLEAIARGVPAGFVADFGVSDALRNRFLTANAPTIRLSGTTPPQFTVPVDASWARTHYFHPETENDLRTTVARRLEERAIVRGVSTR